SCRCRHGYGLHVQLQPETQKVAAQVRPEGGVRSVEVTEERPACGEEEPPRQRRDVAVFRDHMPGEVQAQSPVGRVRQRLDDAADRLLKEGMAVLLAEGWHELELLGGKEQAESPGP